MTESKEAGMQEQGYNKLVETSWYANMQLL